MLTIVRFQIRLFSAAWTTPFPTLSFRLVNHSGRNDAGGNGDDGVTKYHDKAGEEPAEHGHRSDIAIAHGGQSDDCPVDACWYAGELSTWFVALHHEHQCADDCDKHDDKKEIYQNLVHAPSDALNEQIALVDEGKKLEHPEDAYKAERPHQRHVTQWRIDDAEYLWQGGKQIDDTEETENVLALVRRTIHSQSILQCKEEAQYIF